MTETFPQTGSSCIADKPHSPTQIIALIANVYQEATYSATDYPCEAPVPEAGLPQRRVQRYGVRCSAYRG
jgi:hypothetical protein